MDELNLGRRIAESQRLLTDLDSYAIDPRLKTLIRKALKTAVLADIHALTRETTTPNADRLSN